MADRRRMLIGTGDSTGIAVALRRWLRAELPDLVDIGGPRSCRGSARHADAGTATFDRDLRRLRRRILRCWAVGAAGRYALVALAVAIPGAALAAVGLIGWIWPITVPLAVFVLALALRLRRPPSLAQVARLLDDRLGLFDVTATALQVERYGALANEGPAAAVVAEAAFLMRSGADYWNPRSRLGSRDLATAAALILLLALITVVGAPSDGNVPAKVKTVATAGDRARPKGAGVRSSISPPLSGAGARHDAKKKTLPPNRRHVRGLYDYGFEGKRKLPQFDTGGRAALRDTPGAPRTAPPQHGRSSRAAAEGKREKAEVEAARNSATPTSAARSGGSGREASRSVKQLAIGGVPQSGSVSPVPSSPSAPQGQIAGKSPGTADSSSNLPAAGQRAVAGEPGEKGAGRPSGSAEAGHQRASLDGAEEHSEGGRTGGALPLRAGFTAVHSTQAATGRGPRDAQGGGGPGRSVRIAGSALEEAGAGSLGYVPPDPGIARGLDPGIFARYLKALPRIEGRKW